MNPNNRSSLNPMVKWLWDMLSLYSTEEISVPTDFPTQMINLKDVLLSDVSGIVNSTLDFMINNALVKYSIETDNPRLTKKLSLWINNINKDLMGKIPTGITSLAKEYFRERWKGSSLLLLRSKWEKVDGIIIPTKMWFIDGQNISVEDKSETRVIGEEKYGIKLSDDKIKSLPASKDEEIFIQKPFSSWSTLYPTPFLFQRGVWKNLKMLDLINSKGEKIVGKALEYLLMMKKGSEQLALKGQPEFIYSEKDLEKAKEDFESIITKSKNEAGTTKYITNFDTEIQHIIPEYSRAINQALYSPIEKRILAGLGLIEIVEGTATSRKEAILNPKPLMSEVKRGIEDFKLLMTDVIKTVIDLNKSSHKKYFAKKINIFSTPVKQFIDKDMRDHFRSMYDRGAISIETYIDICGEDVYFDVEKKRRAKEFADGTEELMYPHLVQNQEQHEDNRDEDNDPTEDEGKPGDKRSIEKKNYDNAGYEEAPYKKNKDLPKSVKVLPPAGQTLWRKVFNKSLPNGEDYARKVAWSVVKKTYKKDGDKWVKKGSVDRALLEEIVFSVVEEALAKKKETDKLEKASTSMEIINLKLKEKQTKLINKLLDEGEDK